MASVTHAVVATGTNDGSKQVSKNAWNDAHVLTGVVDALVGSGPPDGIDQWATLRVTNGGGGFPTSGTFTLTFDGQTTSGIAFDASASAVQSALEALSNIAPGDVDVTGGPFTAGDPSPIFVHFTGTLAAQTVADFEVDASGFDQGNLTATTTVTGSSPATLTAAVQMAYDSDGNVLWVNTGTVGTPVWQAVEKIGGNDAYGPLSGVDTGSVPNMERRDATTRQLTGSMALRSDGTEFLFYDWEVTGNEAAAVRLASNGVRLSGPEVGDDPNLIIGNNVLTRSLNGITYRETAGTADPSAGGGVAAPIGSSYIRDNSGTGELWFKTGAADTAWTQVV